MKKVIYTAVMLGMVSLVSCKKLYHCNCSYNNKLMYSKDLGKQTQKDAEEICKRNDSTVVGEVWKCTIY